MHLKQVYLAIAVPLATVEDFIVATVHTDRLGTIGLGWWTDRLNWQTSYGESCGPSELGVVKGELPKMVDGASCGCLEKVVLTAL